MKIQLRLLLSFLLMAVILAVYGAFTLFMGQTVGSEVDNLIALFDLRVEHSTTNLGDTLHLGQSLEESRRAMAEYANGDWDAADDLAASIEEFRRLHRELTQSNLDLVQAAIDAGRPEVAQATENHLNALRDIQQTHDRFAENALRYIDLVREENRTEARALRDEQIFVDLEQMHQQLAVFEDAQEMSSTLALEEFDSSIEVVDSNIGRIGASMAGSLVVALVVAVVLSFAISRALSNPIEKLSEVAESIEADEFELEGLKPIAARRDELGQFARVFDAMAREVKAREDKLKQEVQQLKIEIDFVKQREQVDEITDTDFFKDLADKSTEMRRLKKDRGADPADGEDKATEES